MANLIEDYQCIKLDLVVQIIAWISIFISIINTVGWFVLGFNLYYVLPHMILGPFIFIASIFLLKATLNKNPRYVLPWLGVTLIGIVVTAFFLTQWIAIQNVQRGRDVGVYVFELCVGLSVLLCFWLCILAYFRKLHREPVEQ